MICVYKTYLDNSDIEYQRDSSLEYALNPVRKSKSIIFIYLFVKNHDQVSQF